MGICKGRLLSDRSYNVFGDSRVSHVSPIACQTLKHRVFIPQDLMKGEVEYLQSLGFHDTVLMNVLSKNMNIFQQVIVSVFIQVYGPPDYLLARVVMGKNVFPRISRAS